MNFRSGQVVMQGEEEPNVNVERAKRQKQHEEENDQLVKANKKERWKSE